MQTVVALNCSFNKKQLMPLCCKSFLGYKDTFLSSHQPSLFGEITIRSILLLNVYAPLTPVSSFCSCADRINAVACSAGTFVSADKLSCEQCLAGYYCPVDKMDAPVICSNGTYQNVTGQTSCIQCPAGQRCPSVAGVPIDCEIGTYSPVATNECMSCPSGHRYGILVL